MRHVVSQQSYAKFIHVLSGFFQAGATLCRRRNSAGSEACALNHLKTEEFQLSLARYPTLYLSGHRPIC